MRNSILVAIAVVSLIASPRPQSFAQTYAERIVGGLSGPAMGASAPGDTDRLFVGRIWDGEIQVLDLTTRAILPTPFLSIKHLMPDPLLSVEQGLLGLTFDPDYANNGYFYVDYTGLDNAVNIVRYRVQGDPATSNVADPSSAHPILKIEKFGWWHNAGSLQFGPNDGNLYISIGDDGGGNPPPGVNSAQDLTNNLLGKILRVDVHGDAFPDDPARNYAIPPSNPFVNKEGDDEIWAYGLRNPWRATFDRVTGDFWINDTGESAREEVNFQPADSSGGENYAWRKREGTIAGPGAQGGPLLPSYTDPIYDYAHTGPDPLFQGNVIAAGGMYRGPVPDFYGHYFFADNGSRNVWKLDPHAVDPRASVTNVNSLLQADVGNQSYRFPSFAEGADGHLYLMEFDTPNQSEVYRIATHSKVAVWHGEEPTAGNPGDGMNWGDANNWSRGGADDVAFVTQDSVVFASRPSETSIDLGEERMASAVSFAGPYRLQNHTLRVFSGNVSVEQGITATIDAALTAETANHSIRKIGLGKLVVNGDATQIAVLEGTLGGSGTIEHVTVRSGASVAPGASIGIMNVEDSLTMHDGAALNLELNGTDNSNPLDPEFDQLVVGGVLKAAGMLNVTLFNDGNGVYAPADGDSFAILSAGEQITGGFSQISLPELATGLVWEIDPADETAIFLRATSVLRSDYNGNGEVDAADYVLWRELAGQSGGGLVADGTGPNGIPDGVVNDWDRSFWQANFGTSIANGTAVGRINVPEPTTAIYGAIAMLAAFIQRRRQESRRVGRKIGLG
jgi:glucose/arabinose dehydrogenase